MLPSKETVTLQSGRLATRRNMEDICVDSKDVDPDYDVKSESISKSKQIKSKQKQNSLLLEFTHNVKNELCIAMERGHKVSMQRGDFVMVQMRGIRKIGTNIQINGTYLHKQSNGIVKKQGWKSYDQISIVLLIDPLSIVKDSMEEDNLAKILFNKITQTLVIKNDNYLRFKVGDIVFHKPLALFRYSKIVTSQESIFLVKIIGVRPHGAAGDLSYEYTIGLLTNNELNALNIQKPELYNNISNRNINITTKSTTFKGGECHECLLLPITATDAELQAWDTSFDSMLDFEGKRALRMGIHAFATHCTLFKRDLPDVFDINSMFYNNFIQFDAIAMNTFLDADARIIKTQALLKIDRMFERVLKNLKSTPNNVDTKVRYSTMLDVFRNGISLECIEAQMMAEALNGSLFRSPTKVKMELSSLESFYNTYNNMINGEIPKQEHLSVTKPNGDTVQIKLDANNNIVLEWNRNSYFIHCREFTMVTKVSDISNNISTLDPSQR